MAYRSGGGRGGRRPPYGHWRGGDRGARQTGFVRLHRPVPAQYLVPMGYRARMVVPHQDAHPQVTFSPAPPALPPLIFVGPSSPAPRHLAAEPAPPSSALAEEAGKNPLVPERALAPPAAAAAAASAEKTLLMSETAAAAASVVAAQGAADSEGEDAWGGDPAPISRYLALARPNRLGKEAMRSADRFLVDVADNNLFHNVAINPESELIAYEPFVWKDFDVTTIDKHKTKRFPTEEKGTRKTAVQYFWDKYNYNLKYAFGPCLQADSDLYPVYLPMEMGLIDIHKFETAIGSDCVAPVPSLCYHDSSWEEVHIPICGLLMLSKVIGQNRILGYVHALSDVSRVSSCPTLATVRGPEAILEDTNVDLPELTACSVFICVGRCKICMFPKLKTTTVIQLVEDALNKTKTKFWDSSLSFNGKPLHGDEILSEIPVFNNSSIHVIPRIRGGMPYIQHGFEQVWYEQLDIVLAINANTRFQHVVLPPGLRAPGGHEFVYFLGPFTQYLLHRIFIFVFRDGHQRGRCWGGGFGIENILYSTNGDVIIDPMVPWYGYSPQGAAADRLQLHNIIDAHLRLPNGKYAVHVEYLLNLLRIDDEDIWGNLDVITFVINHPSLLSFSDMRKWFDLIDQLIRQLHPNDLFRLRQIFGNPLFDGWNEEVKSVPGFTRTYMRNARLDQTGQANVSVYTRDMDQGFHFARNFLNRPPPGVSQMVSIAAIVNVMELMLAVFVVLLICQFMQPAHGNWNLKEIIANPNSDKSALPP